MVPLIETERLRLRGWEMRDFLAYATFMADPIRRAFVGGVVSREQAWIDFCADLGEWQLRGRGTFAIALLGNDRAIGFTGLWQPLGFKEPELSWSLFGQHVGQGYATEAASAARTWAYDVLGLPPLMSFIHPENLASQAVAKRLGAVFERESELYGEPRHIYRHPK